MNHDTILTVRREHLSRLNSRDAELFVRDLLWEEARRLGSGTCDVKGPSETNAPDGKVDITVDASPIEKKSNIIASGKNCYQIKSGKEFKPWLKSFIKGELFDQEADMEPILGDGIQACLDADGTYILVCTGIHLSKSKTEKACSYIRRFLASDTRREPKVKVWSQDDLIGFLQEFPLLALRLTGRQDAKFQTHNNWARNDDMRRQFVVGPQQQVDIENIRHELHRDDRPVHLRVWGEPGIGKTKLVFEATKVKYLSHLVIYYSTVSRFESCVAMNEIRFDENLSAIVVIDECDPDSRARIWNHMYQFGPRIKLVTIYNDYEDRAGDISYFNTTPLDSEHIRSIIENYHIPTDVAMRYTEFCSGSPRVAHVIGQNLLNHPEDLLKPPAAVNIWDRYVVGNSDPNSLEVKERKRTLRYIALFKRFGYRNPVGGEAKIIAQMAKIDWERFQEIVHELKNRRILQGETTLYITPKALHIKLWAEWWENYGDGFDLEEFKQGLTPKLVEWFYDMFQYAFESGVASEIAKRLLGVEGPFQNGEYLKTRLGSRFFLALTDGDPVSALRCLVRTVGNWDRETLFQFKDGRRNIVWALEKIAVWRHLFSDAAQLLLVLGEAENERYSNNASGVFAGLFSPAYGKVAPTEVPPLERLPILKEAFDSTSKEKRVLALTACDIALKTTDLSRSGSPEYQGLRTEPKLWMPKTYGELWDAYKAVWQLLDDQLACLPGEERNEAVNVLLRHARGVGKILELTEMVVTTLTRIAERMYVNEKELIKTINRILHHDGKNLPDESRQRWQNLMDELVGLDFHSMMQRYVGMDLLEDKFDESRNYIDRAQPRIEELAQQAVDNPVILQPELAWLATVEAEKGYHFGYELGKRDDGFCLLPILLDSQRNVRENASAYFLGGYFRALFEVNPMLWEEQLDGLINDSQLNLLVPELTQRSGLTDRAGLRILNLAKRDIIGVNDFKTFTYGKTFESLSEGIFVEWISFLLNVGSKSTVSVALDLYYRYYLFSNSDRTFQHDLTFQLLSHPALFEESNSVEFDDLIEYDWTEIAKAFLERYPEKHLGLVKLMLLHFGEDGTIVGPYSQTCTILNEITQIHPTEVWQQTSKLLEDRTHFARTDGLEQWLRDGGYSTVEGAEGALTLFPCEIVWKWVDEDTEDRARYIATLVPRTLSIENWEASLMRAMVVRYGTRDDNVRGILMEVYSGEGWCGFTSLHHEEKKQILLQIREIETDNHVKHWIDDFVAALEGAITDAKIFEEREIQDT